jgi:protoporphyrin/coproporphyrin ferrochelatase
MRPGRGAFLEDGLMRPLLLVNMGGPESIEEVERYLEAIFLDPAILPVPAWLRPTVARALAKRRAPTVCERYASIGGGSPLAGITRRQTTAVAHAYGGPVSHAFRYTRPSIEEAMVALGPRIRLLPLFPHYTDAMTGSVVREAVRVAAEHRIDLDVVSSWGSHPAALAAWRRSLLVALRQAGRDARVLFVAHGVPLRNVRRGDPYPQEVEATAEALARTLPTRTRWSLAYQSRIGPIAWTGPYLEDELAALTQESSAPLVIMPLSFVAECLETRYDLDQVAVPEALAAGVERVVRVPTFDDDPFFAASLAEIAREAAREAA